MNVLSLFDGMSAGLQALKQAGIHVKNYYAAEIDKYAIQVSAKNHPEIIRIGDVTKWRAWDLPKIDLLIAGSPCQGFSSAGKSLNFEDPRSALFFEFVEILKELKPRFFMLENVKMKKEWQDIISGLLGVEPVEINSALVSAQNRKRLYWANWEFGQPEDRGILLGDILEERVPDRYYLSEEAKNHDRTMKNLRELGGKAKTITAFGWGFGGSGVNLVQDAVGYRKLTPTECERLQTLPDGYTEKGAYIPNIEAKGKCAKQTTTAVIETNGKFYVGTNECKTPQKECPRKDMPTGVGYELCKSICGQENHAEVNACLNAGKNAYGATLYLVGHTYCCDNCLSVMREHGISEFIIGRFPEIGISNTQRYNMLGNGWTVAVIEHIFKHLPVERMP